MLNTKYSICLWEWISTTFSGPKLSTWMESAHLKSTYLSKRWPKLISYAYNSNKKTKNNLNLQNKFRLISSFLGMMETYNRNIKQLLPTNNTRMRALKQLTAAVLRQQWWLIICSLWEATIPAEGFLRYRYPLKTQTAKSRLTRTQNLTSRTITSQSWEESAAISSILQLTAKLLCFIDYSKYFLKE